MIPEENEKVMSEYLPEDILLDILSRLPVKTLLQYRCVSKTWCSTISSPSFITQHLNKATIRNNDHHIFFAHGRRDIQGCYRDRYLLYKDKDFPTCNGQELDIPLHVLKFDKINRDSYDIHVVGSCHGIICLIDIDYGHRVLLWNPSIRKNILIIPQPTVSFQSHGYFMACYGFGFDSINNDYKLVRLVYLETTSSILTKQTLLPPLVEVYSLKSGCWRMVENNDLKYVTKELSKSAFLNGACHWTTVNHQNRTRPSLNVIVFFNLADDKVGEMILPDGVVLIRDDMDLNVTISDGLLSVVALWNYYLPRHYSIWAMQKYGDAKSWIKISNIEHFDRRVDKFVGFKKNGVAFLRGKKAELLSYSNTENGSCMGTKILGPLFYLEYYMESLVLLNEAGMDSTTASAGNDYANSESKKHSSHVTTDVDKSKKEKMIKKLGKKNMESPEIMDEENKVFNGDAAANSSATSRMVTKEGNGASKELVFGATKGNKRRRRRRRRRWRVIDDEANELARNHNSSASTNNVENGRHEATKELLPSSGSNADNKKGTKIKKGKNKKNDQ